MDFEKNKGTKLRPFLLKKYYWELHLGKKTNIKGNLLWL